MRAVHRRRLTLLIAVLTIGVAIGVIARSRPFEKQSPGPLIDLSHQQNSPTDLHVLPGARQTFLVMGVEGWEGEYGRSDAMIVASYDPKDQRLAILSIPRDLLVEIPGYGYDKVNHAHSFGGPTLAVETVERLLNMKIDHWATVSLDGFIAVINALDGVELNPTERLYHVDPDDSRFGPEGFAIDIQPGQQVMDGLTALEYVRFRADSEGDLGRIRRQRELIQAVITKASSPAIITRIPEIIPAVYTAVNTDMTVGELLTLANTGRTALSNPMVTGTISAEELWLDGTFYFAANLIETRTTAYELLVGEGPMEDFLLKAEQDNDKYQAFVVQQNALSKGTAEQEMQLEAGDVDDPSATFTELLTGPTAEPPHSH